MTPYREMALNNAWANATLYAAACTVSPERFVADTPGFFPSLAATMNHIWQVDLYYIDALEQGGKGRSVYDVDDMTVPADLAAAQAEADLRLARFCSDLAPAQLSETRETERRDTTVSETVAALLLHLFQHQIHHRGQAHTQVHALGVAPPQLDEFYLDYDRAPSADAYQR